MRTASTASAAADTVAAVAPVKGASLWPAKTAGHTITGAARSSGGSCPAATAAYQPPRATARPANKIVAICATSATSATVDAASGAAIRQCRKRRCKCSNQNGAG